MKLSNVKLIFLREFRDQIRDRRMIFMIAVLPLVLYPLLGLNWIQVSQFMQQKPSSVLVVGVDSLPQEPPLIAEDGFDSAVCLPPDAMLLNVETEADGDRSEEAARARIRGGEFDAVVVVPEEFDHVLKEFQENLATATREEIEPKTLEVPEPAIYFDAARDQSAIARVRVNDVLRRWRDEVVQETLRQTKVPARVTAPFEVSSSDVAEPEMRRAAQWSKLLPFIVVIWALTGAFYPAVDLCAGEKERGTLETLLSSPAERSEIVWGKLLTVTVFSMITSLLNLLSMGLTGLLVLSKLQGGPGEMMMEAPPLMAIVWLVLGLIPIAALFSALALAIAAFARSSKEGQYYLMPLLLITLPLMMLPMTAELDLGTALIPVTGLMLLLRKLIEGEFVTAMTFLPPVVIMTGACCLMAVRWAINQFHKESVMFRESERWQLSTWLRHVIRDRRDTPTVSEALLCAMVLLVIRFFASFSAATPDSWNAFATMMIVSQVALIATPAMLMAIIVTRDPLRTLQLKPLPKRWLTLPVAILLALALHPASVWLSIGIKYLYPISPSTIEQLAPIAHQISSAPIWKALLVIAFIPAICEELAFRGFILSGLRHSGHKWSAIGITAVLFGITHGILQQSISATIVGVVIGYITVQSGSLIPAILFHLTHNSLAVLFSRLAEAYATGTTSYGWLRLDWLVHEFHGEVAYHWSVLALGLGAGIALIAWFRSLPYDRYWEESLQERLDHQETTAPPNLGMMEIAAK